MEYLNNQEFGEKHTIKIKIINKSIKDIPEEKS